MLVVVVVVMSMMSNQAAVHDDTRKVRDGKADLGSYNGANRLSEEKKKIWFSTFYAANNEN